MKVYDKIKWHYPETSVFQNKEQAIAFFQQVMNWLSEHHLLTEEGEELKDVSLSGEDFSLHERMLNERGIKLLNTCYEAWSERCIAESRIEFSALEDQLIKI